MNTTDSRVEIIEDSGGALVKVRDSNGNEYFLPRARIKRLKTGEYYKTAEKPPKRSRDDMPDWGVPETVVDGVADATTNSMYYRKPSQKEVNPEPEE